MCGLFSLCGCIIFVEVKMKIILNVFGSSIFLGGGTDYYNRIKVININIETTLLGNGTYIYIIC